MYDGKARVIDGLRHGDSLRIAIDSQQKRPSRSLERIGARLSTATKGPINVDTIRTNIQAVNRFIQKYRSVFKFPSCYRQILQTLRQRVGRRLLSVDIFLDPLIPEVVSSHSSNLLNCPTSITSFVSPACCRNTGAIRRRPALSI